MLDAHHRSMNIGRTLICTLPVSSSMSSTAVVKVANLQRALTIKSDSRSSLPPRTKTYPARMFRAKARKHWHLAHPAVQRPQRAGAGRYTQATLADSGRMLRSGNWPARRRSGSRSVESPSALCSSVAHRCAARGTGSPVRALLTRPLLYRSVPVEMSRFFMVHPFGGLRDVASGKCSRY